MKFFICTSASHADFQKHMNSNCSHDTFKILCYIIHMGNRRSYENEEKKSNDYILLIDSEINAQHVSSFDLRPACNLSSGRGNHVIVQSCKPSTVKYFHPHASNLMTCKQQV